MKKRIRFLACFLAVAFLLSCTGAFADFRSSNALTERMAVETASNLAYNRILEYYGEEAYMLPNESLSEAASQHSGAPDYGDVYAGAYLNEDGKLVVLLANGQNGDISAASATQSNILSSEIQRNSTAFSALPAALKTEAATLSSVAQRNDLIFQQAKYSYSYLESINTALTEAYAANAADSESVWSHVSCIGIYDDKNCIIVEIVNLDDAKAAQFAAALPVGITMSDAIVLSDSSGFAEDNASPIYPGKGVYKPGETSLGGSIGYRAIRYPSSGGTQIGFVTAAHVLNNLQTSSVSHNNGSTLAWATLPSDNPKVYSGSVDAAFLEITNSNYYLDNHVLSSSGIQMVNGYLTPAVGSTVYMAGAKSGLCSGTVLSSNASLQIGVGGKTFTNLVKADYFGQDKDSGGLVYTLSSGTGRTAGIHKGKSNDGYTFFVKSTEIFRIMNVSPYWS